MNQHYNEQGYKEAFELLLNNTGRTSAWTDTNSPDMNKSGQGYNMRQNVDGKLDETQLHRLSTTHQHSPSNRQITGSPLMTAHAHQLAAGNHGYQEYPRGILHHSQTGSSSHEHPSGYSRNLTNSHDQPGYFNTQIYDHSMEHIGHREVQSPSQYNPKLQDMNFITNNQYYQQEASDSRKNGFLDHSHSWPQQDMNNTSVNQEHFTQAYKAGHQYQPPTSNQEPMLDYNYDNTYQQMDQVDSSQYHEFNSRNYHNSIPMATIMPSFLEPSPVGPSRNCYPQVNQTAEVEYNARLESPLESTRGIKRRRLDMSSYRENSSTASPPQPTGSAVGRKRVSKVEPRESKAPRTRYSLTESTYHPFDAQRAHFQTSEEALQFLSSTKWIPSKGPRFPQTEEQKRHYVEKVYNAMVDFDSFFDKPTGKSKNRMLSQQYPTEYIEARCWEIVDTAIDLHENGSNLCLWADPTISSRKATEAARNGKGKWAASDSVAKKHPDQVLDFGDRLDAICVTLREFKSACCDVLDSIKLRTVVYGPKQTWKTKHCNLNSNDNRKEVYEFGQKHKKEIAAIKAGSPDPLTIAQATSEVAEQSVPLLGTSNLSLN